MKTYYEMNGIGNCKYSVNFSNGIKKYPDGSEFFDIRLFKNKYKKQCFINQLKINGYKKI
jgi:hypothetical protein